MSEFSCIGDSTKLNKKKKDWRRAAVHIKTFTVYWSFYCPDIRGQRIDDVLTLSQLLFLNVLLFSGFYSVLLYSSSPH